MQQQPISQLLTIYLRLSYSYVHGMTRLLNARIASNTASIAILQYHVQQRPHGPADPYASILDELKQVSPDEHDSFTYINNISHLVYATTLLDTFLTDTTRFLLLMFPSCIGKDRTFKLEDILAGQSTTQIINQAAEKRCRDLAYQTFIERIQFIKATFGLEIHVDDQTCTALKDFSTTRNTALHDQAIYQVHLTERNILAITRKGCPRHPTTITSHHIIEALNTYCAAAAEVFRAVTHQVLKSPDHPRVCAMIDTLNNPIPLPNDAT